MMEAALENGEATCLAAVYLSTAQTRLIIYGFGGLLIAHLGSQCCVFGYWSLICTYTFVSWEVYLKLHFVPCFCFVLCVRSCCYSVDQCILSAYCPRSQRP